MHVALAERLGLLPLSYGDAARTCDMLFFCVAWEHAESALTQLLEVGDLGGKIFVDPSNPETPDFRSLRIGHTASGAEILAARAPGAAVVKAFNYVYSELLKDPDALARIAPSIFLCGDSPDAVRRVSELIASCGLEPIDCGPLASGRYLEPLALVMVRLVRERGWPPAGAAMKLSHA